MYTMVNNNGEHVSDCIVRFYKPEVPIRLEVVFVHGLANGNYGDAYWKTWLTRDCTPNSVWPKSWLSIEFPFAQIFALKYGAIKKKIATSGRIDLFLLGEMLAHEMVHFGHIGQCGVPVVFVCHGFGGLVAKQIIVYAKEQVSQDTKFRNLSQNIGGFCFYSTPHRGSILAKPSSYSFNVFGGEESPLLKNMEVLDEEIRRLNSDFELKSKQHSWYIVSAGETHATSQDGKLMVEEASSRYDGSKYLSLNGSHFDVVRPKTKKDCSYLWVTSWLEEVTKRFEDSLTPRVKSLLPKGHVRLREQEDSVKKLLQTERIVGLVGMGGIGKTTLAKAVYESICKSFERSSYLDKVNLKDKDDVLIVLLQNLGIKDRRTGCLAQASDLKDSVAGLLEDLRTCMKRSKVLVVVDDVGDEDTLHGLLELMDFMNGNKESKLIVTCRNWQVLKRDVQLCVKKFEVGFMEDSESVELFSYHAFNGAQSEEQKRQVLQGFLKRDSSETLMEEFEDVQSDVVKASGGLPLTLEVMGSWLGGYFNESDISSKECLKYWNVALQKLKQGKPMKGGHDKDKLWKSFKKCYDALSDDAKHIYLDVACFFSKSVCYNEQTLIWIWESQDCSMWSELRSLKERGLVKVNREDGIVTMHKQLRSMGCRIIRDDACEQVKNMTRLWDCNDVGRLVCNNKIKSKVLYGLSLQEFLHTHLTPPPKRAKVGESSNFSKRWNTTITMNCPNMKLLDLHKVKENDLQAIKIINPLTLHWLCLKDSDISNVPNFLACCYELRVLDLSNCKWLKNLPDSMGELVKLAKLQLCGCESLSSLPDSIGKMVGLSVLDLQYCKGLNSLPDSMGELVKLAELQLCGCEGLSSLPDSIGKMVGLSVLELQYCKGLKSLPDSMGELVKLAKVQLWGCEGLTSLPDSIGKMVGLSVLDLQYCKGLNSLPDSMGELVKLAELQLCGCEGLSSLPDSIGKMVGLSVLDLQYCKGLKSLPDSMGELVNLAKLQLRGCEGLTSLPDSIGKMVGLLVLDLQYCEGLKSLPDSMGELVKLAELQLCGCEGLSSLPDSIGKMVGLSVLELQYCKGLNSLPDSMGELVKLAELQLCGCESLSSLLDSIGKMVGLSVLDLQYCKGLNSLPDSMGELVKLVKLQLCGCEGLSSLPDSIGKMVGLSVLDLQYCKGLNSLPDSMGELVKLSKLDLHGCKDLTSLPDSIGKMVGLSVLDLQYCKGLKSLPDSMGELVKLAELQLCGCEGLSSLPDSIGKMVGLSVLELQYCKGLKSLPDSMGELVNLAKLQLWGCEGLTSLPDSIGKMVGLSVLDLQYCKGLNSLPDSMGELVKLAELQLCGCEGLSSLPDSIGKMVGLSVLDLQYCKGLKSLPDSMGELVKLAELQLCGCESLSSLLDSIGKMVGLSVLDLQYCKGLKSLPDSMGELVNLAKLQLWGCEGLSSLPDSIGKMVGLLVLDLQYCEGLKSLPDSMGELVKLAELQLCGCEGLSSLPDSIGKMVGLSVLDLQYCKGLKSLPDSMGELVNLSKLVLCGCEGLTSLPDSIGKLVGLLVLKLCGCSALTSLPSSIGNLSQLSRLDLEGCLKLEWMKRNQILVFHMLQQRGCSKIVLPDGRQYHGENEIDLPQVEHNGDHPMIAIAVVELSNGDHHPVCHVESKESGAFHTSKTLPEGIPKDSPANGSDKKLLSKNLKSVRIQGRGYSGIVYETTWDGGRYARKDFLRVPGDIFEREAKVLVGIPTHPNVVQAFGWTVDKTSCSLVQELMDGNLWNFTQRLRKKLEQKRLEPSDRELFPKEQVTTLQNLTLEELKVSARGSSTSASKTVHPFPMLLPLTMISIIPIAEGLKFLHGHGVAHGDLKPRNILVKLKTRGPSTPPDQELAIDSVKVADYGLIETKSKSRCMTSASSGAQRLNSIRWKAPELIVTDESSGSSLRHGFEDLRKGDVYSFGLLCCEILTGEDPFSDYTVNDVFTMKELEDDVVTRQRPNLPPNCPQRLRTLINQCKARERTKRPSFDRIVEELEKIKQELEGGEMTPSIPSNNLKNDKQGMLFSA